MRAPPIGVIVCFTLACALTAGGCTAARTIDCGAGWRWVEAEGVFACVRDPAGGGATSCPDDAPYPVTLEGATVCTSTALGSEGPSAALCAKLPACASASDGGVVPPDASVVHYVGAVCVTDANCGAGERCVDSYDGHRCHPECTSSTTCQANVDPRSSCRIMVVDVGVPIEACTAPCNPLAPIECGAGMGCGLIGDALYEPPFLTVCKPQAYVAEGEPCDGWNPDVCANGHACVFDEGLQGYLCRRLCDVGAGATGCAGADGTTCTSIPISDTLGFALGYCH